MVFIPEAAGEGSMSKAQTHIRAYTFLAAPAWSHFVSVLLSIVERLVRDARLLRLHDIILPTHAEAHILSPGQKKALSPLVKIKAAKGPVLAAILYLLGAEAAFLVGTLSDKIFAPFWPPNTVLFCAFLFVPWRLWWIYLLAILPAHAWAELSVGMTVPQLLVAFATNVLVAAINAVAVRAALHGPPWLGTLRKASLYILATAIASPAVVAFAGAFVEILGGGPVASYGTYWAHWYAANALGAVTLGSVALAWHSSSGFDFAAIPLRRSIETLLLGIALAFASAAAFEFAPTLTASGFLPAVLYAPLPILLWITVRFGTKGASTAALIVTLVLIIRCLSGSSLFVAHDAETNVLALQLFIIGLAIPILLLGASVDQARNAEQAVRHREEQITFAATNANIGFWQLDLTTDKLWLSDHCLAMLGLPAQNQPSRESILEVLHPEDRGAVAQSMRNAAHDGHLVLNEFRCVTPGGATKWFLARSQPELNDGKAAVRLSGFFADITAQKALEEEAELKRKEVTHLVRISTLGELSGAIAHELHQPLTAILSNAQAAQEILNQSPPNLDEVRAILDDIVLEDARAGEVIERLRRLMRKSESKRESVNINVLVEATLTLLRSEMIQRRVRVETDLAEALPAIVGDPIQLQQVLLNLIMNAGEAMSATPPEQRVITITTQPMDAGIKATIADCGPGFSAEAKQRVFEPFFTTKERGLGLGLSICSAIVASHGGKLHFANRSASGAAAILRLPQQPRQFGVAAP
jgi:signal transduction histidine kinase